MDALTREPVIAPPASRARRWVVLLLCVLATVAIGAGIWFWPAPSPDQKAARMRDANQVIPVVEAVAVKREVPVWLDGLGTVQAFQMVTVKSMVDGPLTDVAFTEGQDVHTGDVLARIDPRVYQAALDNAVAKKALDEATLANNRLDLARYQKLVQTNYATQQQADTAKAAVAQLEAQVRQDQAQIDTATTQLSYTTITSPLDGKVGMRLVDKGNIVHAGDAGGLLVITQLQPISVVFSLPQQNLSQVAAAQAAAKGQVSVGQAGNGQTGNAQVGNGQTGNAQVGNGQAGNAQVGNGRAGNAQVGNAQTGNRQTANGQVATGQGGPEVVAYAQGTDAGHSRPLDRGTLTVLDNQIDPTTGTIKMKATFPNAAGTLWPGGFVGIRLRADTVHGATVVPQSAVQRGPNQSFVFVVDQDSVAHRKNVTIGYEDEQGSVITSGVSPGEHVVVDGASRLTDGAKVSLVQPDATAPGSGTIRPAAPGTRPRNGQGRSGQTGSGQTGADQTGAAQAGTAQTGAAQTGTAQTGEGQTGAGQSSDGRSGSGQSGTDQNGTAPSGTGRGGPGPNGPASGGSNPNGSSSRGSGQGG